MSGGEDRFGYRGKKFLGIHDRSGQDFEPPSADFGRHVMGRWFQDPGGSFGSSPASDERIDYRSSGSRFFPDNRGYGFYFDLPGPRGLILPDQEPCEVRYGGVDLEGPDYSEVRFALGEAPSLPPSIDDDIFRPSEPLFNAHLEAHPEYLTYALLTLVRQLPDRAKALAPLFDTERMMLDPGGLGRLVALFQGFAPVDSGIVEDERIPVFDILLGDGFQIRFAHSSGASQTTAFKLKVLGIGGTGGHVARYTTSARFGPYDRSCQLQAPVRLAWTRYRKASTGEELYTLKVLPIAIKGLYAECEGDPRYKPVERDSIVPLQVLPRAGVGNAASEVTCRVERGSSSAFECPVGFSFGSVAGSLALDVESSSTADFEFCLIHAGAGGHIYGPSPEAVLLQAAP